MFIENDDEEGVNDVTMLDRVVASVTLDGGGFGENCKTFPQRVIIVEEDKGFSPNPQRRLSFRFERYSKKGFDSG